MYWLLRAIFGIGLCMTVCGFALDAHAQDASLPNAATVHVGGAEISVGGGFSTLSLPDIRFGTLASGGETIKKFPNTKDFGSEIGGAFSGDLVVPWTGTSAVAVSGFWSSIDHNHTLNCNPSAGQTCGFSNLSGAGTAGSVSARLTERAKRDVDLWGTQIEGRYYLQGAPENAVINSTYVALGGDIRQLGQDTTIHFTPADGSQASLYNESLDSTYYGGYLAIGGDYSLPLLAGFTSGLGLKSSFKGFVGVYGVDTDYSGKLDGAVENKLGLSSTNTAVIAGVTLETRKQFTPRTSLSFVSSYEFYSWVPDMRYFDPGANISATRIDDGTAWSTRAMLRLNIGLGPSGLYYK